ncbi:MAG: serine hydrolase [Betaproteobacteria bacterium]|nr:MAG: serine hydrolase [Betaproteobacteria bacterium]
MNRDDLEQAVQFAVAHETTWSRDTGDGFGIHHEDPPPWNRLLGPVHSRGPVSGIVVVDGVTLTTWGDPARADLAFSVAKTYLALLAGVAHDCGLMPDVDEPVAARVQGIGFDEGRNALVTWAHLLQQTSEWEGECFGVPEQVDRYRVLSFQGSATRGQKGDARPLQTPGSYWEYNDVRVNQLSLALLHLFGKPLPEVFAEAIMRPIGASQDWQWVGYDNAWVDMNGRRVQSVPGGSHWGGGVSIGSLDQARVGQLLLDDGKVNNVQVISADWIRRMRSPCAIAPFYGYLVWLNHDRCIFPSVPESSFFAIGAGSSFTWIEPERRMVLVVRWIDAAYVDAFFKRVLKAIN